jgi:hypothetical protein
MKGRMFISGETIQLPTTFMSFQANEKNFMFSGNTIIRFCRLINITALNIAIFWDRLCTNLYNHRFNKQPICETFIEINRI